MEADLIFTSRSLALCPQALIASALWLDPNSCSLRGRYFYNKTPNDKTTNMHSSSIFEQKIPTGLGLHFAGTKNSIAE